MPKFETKLFSPSQLAIGVVLQILVDADALDHALERLATLVQLQELVEQLLVDQCQRRRRALSCVSCYGAMRAQYRRARATWPMPAEPVPRTPVVSASGLPAPSIVSTRWLPLMSWCYWMSCVNTQEVDSARPRLRRSCLHIFCNSLSRPSRVSNWN